jgi:hypothetical protein
VAEIKYTVKYINVYGLGVRVTFILKFLGMFFAIFFGLLVTQ